MEIFLFLWLKKWTSAQGYKPSSSDLANYHQIWFNSSSWATPTILALSPNASTASGCKILAGYSPTYNLHEAQVSKFAQIMEICFENQQNRVKLEARNINCHVLGSFSMQNVRPVC